MNITTMSVMAHNEAICRKAEAAINDMLDLVKEHGGKIWIQSKNNKEYYYEITEHVSLNFYMLTPEGSVVIDVPSLRD